MISVIIIVDNKRPTIYSGIYYQGRAAFLT